MTSDEKDGIPVAVEPQDSARVRELRADNERLRELASAASRLAEFGRFAAEQNHELRQPLLAIKGLAQLLLDKPQFDVAEVHEFAGLIVEQSDRMAKLISELKLLSVPRREGISSVHKALRADVGRILKRAATLLDYRIRKRAEILLDVAPDAPAALATNDQVEQIVINLIANALDAVTRIPSAVIQVRVKGIVEDGKTLVETCIADNGSGVPASARARLFQAFFTTKGDEAGTGLGLAVSREIARGFGGDLTLLDAPGDWPRPAVTVFRLTLPAS